MIEIRTDSLLNSLGLLDCANIPLMNNVRKAEKKRVSIGYELVTNPSLVLLDEPTSGLDSISALQIAKLLKKEAKRGLTILCTIHMPSAETFL